MVFKSIVIISILFCSSLWAHKLKVLGTLSPYGSVEIYSTEIDGEIFYKPGSNEKEIGAFDLSVPVKSLDSGIALRNEHIHKYLNHQKHPEILMTDLSIKGDQGSGTITINGVTKKITFKVKESKKRFHTVLKLNTQDFKLAKAKFFHIGVDPDIKVFVDIEKKDIQKKVEIDEKALNSI